MFSAGFCATGTEASSVSGPVWSLSAVAVFSSSAVAAAVAVDLGLGHRVRRRVAPGLADLQQAVVVADHVGAAHVEPASAIRIRHRDAGQRRVAGVGHRDRVADHLAAASAVPPGTLASLAMFSAGFCATGTEASSVSGPVWSLSAVAVFSRAVAAAVAVDLGLGHRVRRRVAPGLADLEQAVVVADHVGAAHDRARIGERIRHHHPGQRRVAGVVHRDRVADQLAAASAVPPRHAGTSLAMFSAGFCATGTEASSVSGPVWSLSAVAVFSSSAVAAAVAVDLGLGHRVRRRVAPGLADLQQGVVVADHVGAAHVEPASANGSVTATPVSVALPVLATVIV